MTSIDGKLSGEFNEGELSFLLRHIHIPSLCRVIAHNKYVDENRIYLLTSLQVTTIFVLNSLDNVMETGFII